MFEQNPPEQPKDNAYQELTDLLAERGIYIREKRLQHLTQFDPPEQPQSTKDPKTRSPEAKIAEHLLDQKTIQNELCRPDTSSGPWGNIVLPREIKEELWSIVAEFERAEWLSSLGFDMPESAILLSGPPGVGKTEIARALSRLFDSNFIAVDLPELKGTYLGHSAHAVKEVFRKAREQAPAVLFIDEIDAIAPSRTDNNDSDSYTKEMLNVLLTELDGINSEPGQILLVTATNLPDKLDPAILSRISDVITIPLPDKEGRAEILKLQLKGKPLLEPLDEIAEAVADLTEGMSGRDLKNLSKRAQRFAKQRAILALGDYRIADDFHTYKLIFFSDFQRALGLPITAPVPVPRLSDDTW